MFPLRIVANEVFPAGLGSVKTSLGVLDGGCTSDLVGMTLELALDISLGILAGLLDITSHIEGVSRGLRDGQTVVEGDAAGDGTETDDNAPHFVNGQTADTTTGSCGFGTLEGVPETGGDNESDDGGDELTNSLHGENRAHHCASPFCSSKSATVRPKRQKLNGPEKPTRR